MLVVPPFDCQEIYDNIFGELSSSRSIQGDRYLQGHHTQIHLTVVFLLPTLGWSYTFFSKYVLLSKQKRGKCILLFSPTVVVHDLIQPRSGLNHNKMRY